MKKYILIILIITITAAACTAVYITQSENKIYNGELSERAKEYLSQQKTGNSTEWQRVDFEGKDSGSREIYVSKESCFEMTVPFPIYREHAREGCAIFITVDDPRGNVVASLNMNSDLRLDEESAVNLRRSKPDMYTEEKISAGGKEFVSFRSKNSLYERTAFYKTGNGIFSLSLTSNTNQNLDLQFKTMLETVTFE